MDENQDCREEIINKLAVWATSGIDDVREAKCDLYFGLSDGEITKYKKELRCRKIEMNIF